MSELDTLARRQHGLVTYRQLRARGLTEDAIDWLVRDDRLIRVRRGVFRMPGAPLTWEQAVLASVLAARGDVLVSHLTSGKLWRLAGFPEPDAIDLLSSGAQRKSPGVRGHRTVRLGEFDRGMHQMIPTTSPARTLVDTCGLVSYKVLERATDDAQRRKILWLPRLVRCVEEIPVSGRRKIKPMRELLVGRVPGYDPGGSDRELEVMAVLRRTELPLPIQQFRVRVEGKTYKLDYAWPDIKQALEWDGYEHHGQVGPFHNDRARTRRLQRAGWTVWPLTSRTTENEILAIAAFAWAPETASSHGVRSESGC